MNEKERKLYKKILKTLEREDKLLKKEKEWGIKIVYEEKKEQAIKEAMEDGMSYNEAKIYVLGEEYDRIAKIKEEEMDILKKRDITRKIERAEEKVLKRKSIKDIWMFVANQRSYYNEPIIEILFYVLMGQVFKELIFYKGNGKKFDLKLNCFIIQGSRSGKNEATDVLQDLVDKLKFLSMGKFSGQDTDAALLRSFGIKSNGKYDFTKEIPGKLEQFDFYLFREASCLLRRTSYNERLTSIFLDIMEGKTVTKSLKSYEGHQLVTDAKGSLIATSRPEHNIKKNLVESGFFQRCLCFMRKLDTKIKKKMNEKVCLNLTVENPKIKSEEYDKALMDIANEIIEIRMWGKMNASKVEIENPGEFNITMNKFIQELEEKIMNELGNQIYKNIVNTFIGNYNVFILKMSYINAMVNRRLKIELSDAIEAMKLLRICYKYLVLWLEESIKIDYDRERRIKETINILTVKILRCRKQEIKLNLKDGILVVSKKLRVSPQRGRQIIDELTTGVLAPFKKTKGEKYNSKFIEINTNILTDKKMEEVNGNV